MELKPDSYTIRESSYKLGISDDAVRKRIKRGVLESYKINGRVYVIIPTDINVDIGQNLSKNEQSPKNDQVLSTLEVIDTFKLFKETTTVSIDLLREQCQMYKDKAELLEEKIKTLSEEKEVLTEKNIRLSKKNKDLFKEVVNSKETLKKKPKKK